MVKDWSPDESGFNWIKWKWLAGTPHGQLLGASIWNPDFINCNQPCLRFVVFVIALLEKLFSTKFQDCVQFFFIEWHSSTGTKKNNGVTIIILPSMDYSMLHFKAIQINWFFEVVVVVVYLMLRFQPIWANKLVLTNFCRSTESFSKTLPWLMSKTFSVMHPDILHSSHLSMYDEIKIKTLKMLIKYTLDWTKWNTNHFLKVRRFFR